MEQKTVEWFIDEMIGEPGCRMSEMAALLEPLSEGEGRIRTPVRLRLHSCGGWLFEAFAIANLIEQHGDVHVHVEGTSAGAACLLLAAAKKRSMSEHAYLAFFEPYAICTGGPEEMAQTGRLLERMAVAVADYIGQRCATNSDAVRELMRQNRWLDAKEALELVFVDEVV